MLVFLLILVWKRLGSVFSDYLFLPILVMFTVFLYINVAILRIKSKCLFRLPISVSNLAMPLV